MGFKSEIVLFAGVRLRFKIKREMWMMRLSVWLNPFVGYIFYYFRGEEVVF